MTRLASAEVRRWRGTQPAEHAARISSVMSAEMLPRRARVAARRSFDMAARSARRTAGDGCFRYVAAEFFAAQPQPASTPREPHPAFSPVSSTALSSISFTSAGTTSVFPRSTSNRWACSRQVMLGCFSVSTSFSGVASFSVNGLLGLRLRVDDAVDAAVLLVAQVGLVGVALAGLEARRRRVVLDDEVVPVDHPHVPVRARPAASIGAAHSSSLASRFQPYARAIARCRSARASNVAARWPVGSETKAVRFQYSCG